MDLPSIPGFRLIRQLGSGGMGVVYLAVQESLDREVAIKCLSAPQGDGDRQVRRFLNEGRTLARLTHANVVCVFDVRSPPPLMVMEYLAGGTLSERARLGMTLAEVLCFIAQVASGLAFVHRARIVHRDIKPPNIMFRSPHVAVLTDFGIAKESGQDHSLTQTGQVIGTTAYMSPEQLGTGEADGRSDQYSLGIVLYELLAGRRPFLGSTFYELAMQQLSRRPDPLIGPVAVFDPIVQRMLAKSPEQRFPDCDSLVEALRALVRAEASLEAQLGLQREDPISEQLRQLGFGGSSRRAGASAPTDKSSVMVGSAASETEAPVSDSSRKGAAAQASLGHLGAALRSAVFELNTLQAAVAELPLDTGSKLDMEVKYQLLAAVARACTELEQLDGLQQLSGLIDRLSTRFPDWREWASLSESCHVRVGQLQTAARQRLQAESCYEAALVALRAHRLLPPEPDSALDCLQQALALDPAHAGAKALLAKLPEAVELTADRLHHAGEQAAALALVRSGLEVFPGHEELDELRRMLEQELRMQTLERERDARLLALAESVATGKIEALVDAILVLVELNEVARLAPAGQHLLASVVQQLESLTRGDGVAIDTLLEGLGSFSAMVEVPQLQHFPGRLQAHRQQVRQLSRLAAERAAAEVAERARRAEAEAQEAVRRREAEAREAAERARRAEVEVQEAIRRREAEAREAAERARRAEAEAQEAIRRREAEARETAERARRAEAEAREQQVLARQLRSLATLPAELPRRAVGEFAAGVAALPESARPQLWAALDREGFAAATLAALAEARLGPKDLADWLTVLAAAGVSAVALVPLRKALQQRVQIDDEAGRKAQAEREHQAAVQALQSELVELRRALPPGNLRLTEWRATLQRLAVLMQEPMAAAVSEVLEQLAAQLLADLARADGEALAAIVEIRSIWTRLPGAQAGEAVQRLGVAIGARRAALEQQAIAGHRQAWLSRFLARPTAEDLVEAERDARLHGCAHDWSPSTQRQILAAVRQLVRSLLDQEAVTAAEELCQRLPLLGDLAGLSALLAELRPQLYAARAQLDTRQRRQQWLQSLEGLRQGFPSDQPASPEQWREALHRLGEVAVHEDADHAALQACVGEWSARAVQQLAAASAAELDSHARLEPAWAALAQRQLPGAVSATENYQHALRARREELAAEMRRHRRQAWIERFARAPKPEAFAELADPVLADSAPDWSRAEAQAVGEAVSRLLMPMLQAGELDRVQQLLEQLKTAGTHPQLGKATAVLQAGLSGRRRAEEAQRLKVEDATADHQRWRKTLVPYYRDGAAATSDLDWLLGFSEVLPPEALAESLQAWQHRAAEWVERGQAEGLSQSARWLTSLAASSLAGLPMGRLSDANRSLEERLQEQAAAEQRERDHAVHGQALEQAETARKARPAVEAVLTMIRAADGSSQARAWSVQLRRRLEARARRALAADQPDDAQAWLGYVPSEWDGDSTRVLRKQASQAAEAARTALITAAAAADSSSLSTDATAADPAAGASIDQRVVATELRESATESMSENSVLPNRESDPDAPGPADMATPFERPALTRPKPTTPRSAPASAASYPPTSPSSASRLPPSGARSVAWIGAAIVGIVLILLSWWLLRQGGSESSTAPPGRPHESVTTPSAAVRQATMPGLMAQHSCASAVLRLT